MPPKKKIIVTTTSEGDFKFQIEGYPQTALIQDAYASGLARLLLSEQELLNIEILVTEQAQEQIIAYSLP